ncbi:MAG: alkaline phosphatase D family protein [Acidobacteriota bacterium]|nr:alkaline phosphatase D family protein [Acidobacteriota bacterium]
MKQKFTRRKFIQDAALITTGLAVAPELASQLKAAGIQRAAKFVSDWSNTPDRVWIGSEYWANPLQDWRVAGGRLECVKAAPDRNVHLLTHQLGERQGDLQMSVQAGRVGGALNNGKGSFGFRIGIMGPLDEYRNSLVFGNGLDAGLTAEGNLFIGKIEPAASAKIALNRETIELRLNIAPNQNTYQVKLSAYETKTNRLLGEVVRDKVPAERLTGNIALVTNYSETSPNNPSANARRTTPDGSASFGSFWFDKWQVQGTKVEIHEERAFGPILFSQYSLSNRVMKMTAQMPPVGAQDSQSVRLKIRKGRTWTTVAEEKIHEEARTATFRVEKWNDGRDVPYRLAYTLISRDGTKLEHHWTGTVRRDPVNQPVLTVADISCNNHAAFPNAQYVANMAKLNPDLLAFVGDQFYESTGGYGVQRAPLDTAIIDYLRKWYIHGWTWRELTRDRPSISLPDDHDVYQGNIWGETGAARRDTQAMGGYNMSPAWVNVVHRTQSSHHPDAYDPTPIKQNISVYYGAMTYGRVSFAVIADRMFKSGPEGKVPTTKGRADHATDPKFDPKTADRPGLELLGERQMKFLREWATDWRGADMKAVVSQTIFAALPTTHGAERQRLRADYDANGWPQTPRNDALREIRKAFAVHIAGDQHLPAVVRYGVDEHDDAGVAFAGPAVNVSYPRWWEPTEPGKNRPPGAPENTGEFLDHFGNPMTVMAVVNGAVKPRASVMELLHDKASGLGLVRFDKRNRKIIFECWPFLADPTKPNTQFKGFPVTVNMLDNYGRKAVAHLPTLKVRGVENPVVQVIEEGSGEAVYTLRIAGRSFQPHVFTAGKYTVRISEPETNWLKEIKGIEARANNQQTLEVVI